MKAANGGSAGVAPLPSIRLGGWSFYFLVKFLLYSRELISFHPLENLAFAAFLLLPVAQNRWRAVRNVVALPVAVALFYYDSWLPPIERVLSQASLLQNFSAIYLLELVQRFINWKIIAAMIIGWAAYLIVARYIRVGLFVVLALVTFAAGLYRQETQQEAVASVAGAGNTALSEPNAAPDLDAVLRQFHEKEALRKVSFGNADRSEPFDIVLIHVCSLSWDDLRAAGLDKHPIWNDFDFLFRNFNTAASYSGPAAIRVNRATCGQAAHESLYLPVSDQCYLMPSLEKAGFEPNLAFNHDGHFDDFLEHVRKQGISAPLMPMNGIPVSLRSFDNSPIYDDYAVLSRWLENRSRTSNNRVALFYNSISLHDGNRIVAGPNAKLSSTMNYRPRVEKLLNDITAFMNHLQTSGRRALVVMVPEHGAALRGDKFQIAGLREIPTPAITTVPVGMKVIGPNLNRSSATASIEEPSSYFAMSTLISRLIEQPPFGGAEFGPKDYAADLPSTEHVASNEGTTVLQNNGRYYVKADRAGWKPYLQN